MCRFKLGLDDFNDSLDCLNTSHVSVQVDNFLYRTSFRFCLNTSHVSVQVLQQPQ